MAHEDKLLMKALQMMARVEATWQRTTPFGEKLAFFPSTSEEEEAGLGILL